MMKLASNIFLLVCIAVSMAGCKLAVIVVEGGEVQSISSGTCLEGTICVHQVNDTTYAETFTAIPNSGWMFDKWNSGHGFFCQDSTDPICVISGEGTEENEAIAAIVESDKTFYIMPIFRPITPITDTVTVDGREWAQVDLFTNLTWDHINAVCPEGVCAGILNGFDMTGWAWASVDDVNALFNFYIGSEKLGPGPDCYPEELFLWGPYPEWAANYHNDGMRTTYSHEASGVRTMQATVGYVSEYRFGGAGFWEFFSTAGDIARICTNDKGEEQPKDEVDIVGGWLYR
jgi:hypothetical protein